MNEIDTTDSETLKLLLKKYNVFTSKKIDLVDNEYLNLENQKYYSVLRDEFKLHTIAGQGSELNKLFRIIRWVNKFVPLNKPVVKDPQLLDGYSILKKVIEGYSLNCAGYSLLTNDLLLALGFKSKCIWCMSYYFDDNECHVVNQVYLNQLKKWVMVDASFGHLPIVHGNFLDVIEFRTSLCNDDNIILKKSERFDFSLIERDRFINYMYKNSFRFIFTDKCKFNVNNKFYSLIPKNFNLGDYKYNGIANIISNINYIYI